MTLWPERHFGQSDTLARDTLARVTFWPVFLASFGVPKDEKKFHGGDHREKFEKNNHHFSEKKGQLFFSNFSLWSPLWNFYSSFGTPKEARKTGQSVTLAKVSLAKVSLWPKCHWPKCHSGQSVTGQSVTSQSDTGQTVSPAKLSLAKVSLAKRSLWPKCHSGQNVPAKVSLAKVSFWPNCDSAIFFKLNTDDTSVFENYTEN